MVVVKIIFKLLLVLNKQVFQIQKNYIIIDLYIFLIKILAYNQI